MHKSARVSSAVVSPSASMCSLQLFSLSLLLHTDDNIHASFVTACSVIIIAVTNNTPFCVAGTLSLKREKLATFEDTLSSVSFFNSVDFFDIEKKERKRRSKTLCVINILFLFPARASPARRLTTSITCRVLVSVCETIIDKQPSLPPSYHVLLHKSFSRLVSLFLVRQRLNAHRHKLLTCFIIVIVVVVYIR